MLVVLMRHADAGEVSPGRWPDDRQRPLTAEGRAEQRGVAEALRRLGLRFDRILTSPSLRARQTAEITAEVHGTAAPALESTEALSDRGDLGGVLAALQSVPAAVVLCVGHEPLLSRLAAALISRDGSARIEMKKSGVAVIECREPPAPGEGWLRVLLAPPVIVSLAGPP